VFLPGFSRAEVVERLYAGVRWMVPRDVSGFPGRFGIELVRAEEVEMENGNGGKTGLEDENSATAGQKKTAVRSETPENATGELNPSAPGETGTTPGTHRKSK
jgi:hypothetical protein